MHLSWLALTMYEKLNALIEAIYLLEIFALQLEVTGKAVIQLPQCLFLYSVIIPLAEFVIGYTELTIEFGALSSSPESAKELNLCTDASNVEKMVLELLGCATVEWEWVIGVPSGV